MVSFTLKGKNFPPRSHKWGPKAYYYENGDMKWVTGPTEWPLVSQTVSFSAPIANIGFWIFFRDAAGESIIGPYGWAATDLFILKNGGKYILDFHGEVGVPTLLEEEIPEKEFTLEMLLPMSPLEGPPLPQFLGIYWPWYEGEKPYG